MAQSNPQVPWTDEQWARVNQVIQEEANRARIAATFLPLYGPLPASADFVRTETVSYDPLRIADKITTQLATLQLNVRVRGEQLADPEMASALTLFRRAANIVARLEDALVFNGFAGYDPDDDGSGWTLPYGAPDRGEQIWGGTAKGLLIDSSDVTTPTLTPRYNVPVTDDGNKLVDGIVTAIGYLEGLGHFGPFAVVLSQQLFSTAQTPVHVTSLIAGASAGHGPSSVPQDRIVPFLGGGPLLRSSTLLPGYGVVVALGGAPIELVVASDMTLEFLQVAESLRFPAAADSSRPPQMEGPPYFLFRVYEKVSLRIREQEAIVGLVPPAAGAGPTGGTGATGATGGTPPSRNRSK
jgi:Encapsulating protein for peroxidase